VDKAMQAAPGEHDCRPARMIPPPVLSPLCSCFFVGAKIRAS